jgi:hypothetical protein
VIVPVVSVVVVVVSVTPLGPVATVVEDEEVCPKATEPIRAVANVTLRINLNITLLSILPSFPN